jgi:hypothetical protein
MAEHHGGTLHLVGGMDPAEFRAKVESGEIDPFTGRGMEGIRATFTPGLSAEQTGMSTTGSVALTGEGNE